MDADAGALLLPVVCCAGVDAVWGVCKLTYPAEFIARLAAVVSTPVAVVNCIYVQRFGSVGRCGAGVNGSVCGAVSAAHLAGERKPVLIRGWPSPAAPDT